MGCFVIAEAGVNHNGRLDLALQMVQVAAQAGAQAIKFQTFSADDLVLPGTEKAAYQRAATGHGDQKSMLKALELNAADHARLYAACEAQGLEFMSTPFSLASVDLLADLGVRRFKVASGEITNFPLLRRIAAKGLPIVMSTGMAYEQEVAEAIDVLVAAFPVSLSDNLVLLHCTSNYPTADSDVNLRAMLTLRERFGRPVGYSDHTQGITVALTAVALGATVIEKHFTLDRDLPGPDHKASLAPDELGALIGEIRRVEAAMGRPEKAPTASELPIRELARRSIAVIRPVDAGAPLSGEDLAVLRPGTGIAPRHLEQIVGRRAGRRLQPGTLLRWDDLA
jgi:N-acetylneuraminate synthase